MIVSCGDLCEKLKLTFQVIFESLRVFGLIKSKINPTFFETAILVGNYYYYIIFDTCETNLVKATYFKVKFRSLKCHLKIVEDVTAHLLSPTPYDATPRNTIDMIFNVNPIFMVSSFSRFGAMVKNADKIRISFTKSLQK